MATGKMPGVAIIGAGVIGLSIGWTLARAGVSVTVFERDRAGRGASFAAGGMLAATLESEEMPAALSVLARRSLVLWPHFAREVEQASGMEVFYRGEGTILMALDAPGREDLRRQFARLVEDGHDVRWLSCSEARALEPALAPDISGAILSPGDHQVDNRSLSAALAQAFLKAGGTLREETPVTRLLTEGDVCKGVVIDGGSVHADAVILAAGAWSAALGAAAVFPVKGHILALRTDAPPLRHVVWAPDAYLAPRRDRVVVGATVEKVGFDDSIVPATIERLRQAACRAVPTLGKLPICERIVGFRPGTPAGLPLIGPSHTRSLILATGHYRNGILLAPVTAEIVAELVLKDNFAPLATGLAPKRDARA
jgi:glycine oxidase